MRIHRGPEAADVAGALDARAFTRGTDIYLPQSHGAWRPVATAESWNGNAAGTCNGYGFRFGQIRVATRPGGAWQPLTGSRVLSDTGYHVHQQPDALLATGGV